MKKLIYKLEEVLPYVKMSGRKEKKDFDGDEIKITSDRLRTFKAKGTKCVCCGLEGNYFKKDKNDKDKMYHFNLYGVKDGEPILMTKDHIIPKSKGGKNYIDNYQPMCEECNKKKGTKSMEEFLNER